VYAQTSLLRRGALFIAGYSFVEFFLSQSMECFLAAHRHALEYFGGATRRAMHDNLKSAVLERIPSQAPTFNPRLSGFCRSLRLQAGGL